MINYGNCEIQTAERKIVLSEKKSKITFLNEQIKIIRKIVIDNCFIIEGIRCDFLLITPDYFEYFIELKGSDVSRAIKQLERTIELASNNKYEKSKVSIIISNRCPLSSPEIQLYKLKFKKKYKCELIIKNSPYEHKI